MLCEYPHPTPTYKFNQIYEPDSGFIDTYYLYLISARNQESIFFPPNKNVSSYLCNQGLQRTIMRLN
jgi:hypothetical protein